MGMVSAILEKLLDALDMFWQALDLGERRIVVVVAGYLGVGLLALMWRAVTVEVQQTEPRIIVVERDDKTEPSDK